MRHSAAAPATRLPGVPRPPAVLGRRSVVDHGLRRRAVLRRLATGATARADVCDADPYLLRAARFHGEPAGRDCPVCRDPGLALVSFVFGDELGQFSGRIRSRVEIGEMSASVGEVRVATVEVCRRCSWNHLALSYLMGDGTTRRPPRHQHTVLDDD